MITSVFNRTAVRDIIDATAAKIQGEAGHVNPKLTV